MPYMDFDPFVAPSAHIDSDHPTIQDQAERLAYGHDDPEAIARACFEWVRDEIQHSGDFRRSPTTCTASDVLREGTGYCYAKSHLLVALLRANSIPAGLCYQRLTSSIPGQYCLHGLTAVHLLPWGWYRVDPRGNKPNIGAAFHPPQERLAWPGNKPGEFNFPDVWAQPMPSIVDVLTTRKTWDAVKAHLPDTAPESHAGQWHPRQSLSGRWQAGVNTMVEN